MGVSLSIAISQNSQSIASNTSDVTVVVSTHWNGGSYNHIGCWLDLIIDGENYGFTVKINPSKTSSGSEQVAAKTVSVSHNSDGTKKLECTASLETGTSSGTVYASASKTLTTIPRVSTLSAAAGTLGTAQTLTIEKKDSSLTHTLTYKCGDVSGTILSKSSAGSVSWTPPLTLAQQNTSGTSVPITFTLTTYSGSTAVGSETTELIYSIPASVKPTVSIAVVDDTGYYSKYGGYIQGQSVLNVELTAAGSYGSTVESYSTVFDDRTFTGASFTVKQVKGSGSLTLTATVKDSRGRTGTASVTLKFFAYEPPKITAMVAMRCDSDGTLNSAGAYIKVTFDAAVTSLSSQNSAAYVLKYKKSTATSYTSVTLSSYAGKFSVSGGSYIFAADASSSYDITITATDSFDSRPKSVVGSSVKKLWSAMKKGVGFAFGKVAELAGYLDMGFHIYMNGNRLHGLTEPTDPDEAVTLGYLEANQLTLSQVYPVGAIYLSTVSTSPASLFGGTWAQITDRFLLAAGSSYAAGATGGASSVILTVAQIPSHTHWGVRRNAQGDYYGTHSYGASNGDGSTLPETNATGGGQAHTNMPPYLVVYMWKRTA